MNKQEYKKVYYENLKSNYRYCHYCNLNLKYFSFYRHKQSIKHHDNVELTHFEECDFEGRPIAYKTYVDFCIKYNLPYKNRTMKELQEIIYDYEMNNIDKLESGLYLID